MAHAPRAPWWSRAVALALSTTILATGVGLVASDRTFAADASACPSDADRDQFSDVAPGSVHASSIDCIAWWGITSGRGDGTFGAALDVTRGQLATFLVRVLEQAGRAPEDAPDAFDDDDGTVHERSLDTLAALGIMEGVGPRRAAPATPVTRAQSASLIAGTLTWLTGEPLPPAADAFSDDDGSPHEQAINGLAAEGIVAGTTAGAFGPNRVLTRAQMASVLVRSLSFLVDLGVLVVPSDAPVQLAVLDERVLVRWRSTVGNPHRWKVLAFADGYYVGQRTFAGAARSGYIDHLPAGTEIMTWVVPMDASGGWREGSLSDPLQLPRDPRCPATSGVCAHIDARSLGAATTGVGLGLLHGVTPETDSTRISALRPRHWRLAALDAERFDVARRHGGSITLLLSDAWHSYTATSPDGPSTTPWADWARYEEFIATVVRWHRDRGILPDRWEVQNEPSDRMFTGGEPLTSDLLVELHVRAAAAVRSVIPDAKIVGPSVLPVLFGHGPEDLEAFLTKVAAADLDLDGITWHELIGYCFSCDGGPSAVLQHIDDARAALRAAGLGSLPIDITEFAAPWEQLQPGAIVGYFRALSEGGVRYGGTACWGRPDTSGEVTNSCFARPGTLDGLLLTDGTTPTDAWWTHEAYARLAAGGARAATATIDAGAASVLASVTGSDRVHALIGRHVGCTSADDHCPLWDQAPPGQPAVVTVRLSVPASGSWTITVSSIASTSGAAGPPRVLDTRVVQADSAAITVGEFTMADGEVLQVEAIRS